MEPLMTIFRNQNIMRMDYIHVKKCAPCIENQTHILRGKNIFKLVDSEFICRAWIPRG